MLPAGVTLSTLVSGMPPAPATCSAYLSWCCACIAPPTGRRATLNPLPRPCSRSGRGELPYHGFCGFYALATAAAVMPLLWVAILTSVAALENKSAVTLTLRIEGETRLSFSPPKQKQFMAGLSMATAIIPHDTSILHINSHGGTECMSFCEVLVGVELLVSGPADVRRLRKRLSGRHFERTLAARMHDSGFDFFVAAHNVALVRSSIAYPPRLGGPSSSSSQGSSNSNSSGLLRPCALC